MATSTILRSFTDYETVTAMTTRTIFATQISVITSTIAVSTSIVLMPTTIYSTQLVGTTFILTSTALSISERAVTTTIFTGQTIPRTLSANGIVARAEPAQALHAKEGTQRVEATPADTARPKRYWAPNVRR